MPAATEMKKIHERLPAKGIDSSRNYLAKKRIKKR
jgi:hypothetical protein